MNRIKEIRTSIGMRQVDLAEKLCIKQNTLSNWESGRYQPDHEALRRLAEIFGCTVDYILGVIDDPGTVPESDHVRIPVLGSIPAGIPIEAIEEIIDWEELPRTMVCGGREYFGLQVKGDSMFPDYLPGDTIIVRKSDTCENGDVCVVYVDGSDATLKEVKLDELAGSMTLLPHNTMYPPRTFSREEIENTPVTIAGVVVELRRKIKK